MDEYQRATYWIRFDHWLEDLEEVLKKKRDITKPYTQLTFDDIDAILEEEAENDEV